MRRILFTATAVAAATTLFSGPGFAHDVWMQANRFIVPVGATVAFRVFAGHGSDREEWNVGVDRLVSVERIGPDGNAPLKPTKSGSGNVSFSKAGTHIVAMVSNNSKSDLPAAKFNDYARDEGLTPAIELREKLGLGDRNGREVYSRRTKMLVKVGKSSAVQAHVLRPLGLTLEIVPERDPYAVRKGAPLPLRIYYLGKPLVGATVKLTNLDADAKPVARLLSDMNGRVVVARPGPGNWQVNTIWTRPLVGNPSAEFDTVFSSLTFGR